MKRLHITHMSFDESQLNTICLALAISKEKILDKILSNPDDIILSSQFADIVLIYNQLNEVRKTRFWNK